jgi:xanthine/CO dehydrogenase XdhC/CoxF family maturation factor
MNRRENERLVRAIDHARQAGQRIAIATVVRVRGSAYRREGARIVVREDGSYECLLSGGCLEPVVAEIAAQVLESGQPVIREYDLEEDSIWSLALGCSGAVDIYIERLEDDPLTNDWLATICGTEPAVVVKRLSGAPGRLLVRERDTVGSLGDDALDREAIAAARARMRATVPASGPEQIGGAEVFFDVTLPPPELVIFGAGPDAEPLARQGWELGFTVTVVDVRAAFLTHERFPHARLMSAHFSRFHEALVLHQRSYAVIMNHHLERDRESLRFALESGAAYVGALGPRSRFQKLLGGLHEQGVVLDPAQVARVHSPVGLALGAESPEEIAVSIMGEILAIQRGFDGGFLAGCDGSLHRSSESSAFARS